MRTTNTRSLVVLAIAVVGVLGLGVGRADAATPSRVTRYSKDFTVTLKATGSGVNFQCANIRNTSTGSVSAAVGSTNIGAGKSFTCTLGSQRVALNYGITNSYSGSRYASANHYFSLTWTNGTSNYTCRTWTKASEQNGTVTSTFNLVWNQLYLRSSNSGSCGGVTVSATAEWLEGWSAS